MAYKLLGMAVWKGSKLFLRRKYGRAHAPKPLLVGGLLALALAAVFLLRGRVLTDS